MSSVQITIPKEYGYVLLAALSTSIVSITHMLQTGKYRRLAQIPYPAAYASDEKAASSEAAHIFNCAQRAHSNFMEHQPSVVTSLLVAGVQFPVSAAALGGLWSVGRLLYLFGYVDPKVKLGRGRYRGSGFAYIGELGLVGLVGYSGLSLILGW